MDIEKMSFKPKTFDAVWCSFVLLHVDRKKHAKIIQNFATCLKTDGILCFGFAEGKGEKIMAEPYNRKYKNYFVFNSKNEMKETIQKAGFEILKYDSVGYGEEGDIFKLGFIYARKI